MTSHSRRCLVHVGAPKTGSTFLQKLCFDNRPALRDAGVLYPDVSLRGNGHHDLAFLLSGGYPKWASPQPRNLTELAAELSELAAFAQLDILLSSEDFYLFPAPQALHRLLTETGILPSSRVVVIVYVRRQDLAHESWYNQIVKAQGYTRSFEEAVFEFRDLWDYDRQLQAWESVFGAQSLVVRVYEPGQLRQGDLAADFLDLLGVPLASVSLPHARVNGRLNYDLLEMQRRINQLPLNPQQKRLFHKELIELTERTRGTSLFDDTPLFQGDAAERILETYAAGNARVAARYFGRDQLFYERPAPLPKSEPYRRGPDPDKILLTLFWLLSNQGGRTNAPQ